MYLKKRLGQNLLIDKNILRKIISAMNLESGDIFIEIGPGLGAITESLLTQCRHYVGIEIDNRFCEQLEEKFGTDPKFELINSDFLKVDLGVLIGELRQRFPDVKNIIIFGNLPYYITTPIIVRLIEHRQWDKAFLTVQLEVAQRLIAEPGSKIYGSITLFLNYHLDAKKLFKIPAGAFLPRPKVDSAFLSFAPLVVPPVEVPDEQLLFKIIRTAFSKRRKTLRNSLKYLELDIPVDQKLFETLSECGINLGLRPERLSIEDFAEMTRAVHRAIHTSD